jgi:hypothetical protein
MAWLCLIWVEFEHVRQIGLKVKPILPILWFLLLVGLVAHAANGQGFAAARDLSDAARALDNAPKKSPLPCSSHLPESPRLDFLFRYAASFEIDCRLGGAIQPGATWFAILRITNQFGKSVIMLEEFDIPQIPRENPTRFDAPLSEIQVAMSGGFAMGPGKYLFELVLTDQRGDTFRRDWKLKPSKYSGEEHIRSALQPGVVAPLLNTYWDGALASRGLRVTVLLHAYSPYYLHARLYPRERADLLEQLATLLNQIPCQSVKLIAFNLDWQEELFRQDSFDADGFVRLEKALDQVQFVTIPYQAIMGAGWANFLVDMEQREATSDPTPDVIVFLGPWGSHAGDKLPSELLQKLETHKTQIFYFKFYGFSPPDALEKITRDLHGSVFSINSPGALEHAIKAMRARMDAVSSDSSK